MFNVFWNFIYTGTPYALHRKVNQRNFGTGMSTRLAVIPLPDKGMAKRHQQVDPTANETLSTWAYRLDKVEGELPVEPLNDETFEWQTAHMEIAEFNGDKADRTLLKRIPYYGIGISLPFILMRHWDEWQEHRTLTMDETTLPTRTRSSYSVGAQVVTKSVSASCLTSSGRSSSWTFSEFLSLLPSVLSQGSSRIS